MVKTTKKPSKKNEPKVKSSTRRTPAHKNWVKQMWPKQWLLISLGLFLLLVLGFVGFTKMQITQEKKQFDTAEAGLDTLYANIVKTLGQPVSSDKSKSCGYASAKMVKGRLGCSVSFVAYFQSSNRDTTRDISKKVESIIRNTTDLKISFSGVNSETYYANNRYETGTDFMFKDTNIDCTARYQETNQDEVPYPGFRLGVACGGDAKAEHYPVKN